MNRNITFLKLLQLLFIYMKLAGHIDWSWYFVFIPFMFFVILHLADGIF